MPYHPRMAAPRATHQGGQKNGAAAEPAASGRSVVSGLADIQWYENDFLSGIVVDAVDHDRVARRLHQGGAWINGVGRRGRHVVDISRYNRHLIVSF